MIKKLIAVLIFLLLFVGNLSAAEKVNVGGYIFPPFVEKDDKGKIYGMTLDLIDALNKAQAEYHFSFVLTSSRRRYASFEQGEFEALFFESVLWGWQKTHIEATKVFLEGGEVFITLANKAKNQEYFNNIKNKSIAAMLGYHYNFAGFNADPEFLRSTFNIHLSNDEKLNIQLVLLGRVEVAIVTKSYLDRFILDNPSTKSALLISNKMDQAYNHTVLLKKNSNLSATRMNALLDKLVKTGEYNNLLRKYGLEK
jgi:ABC-type amino acid transport substrate-binding protein